MSGPGSRRSLWPYAIVLVIIVVALMSTVFLPFVNTSTLWFGLPSVAVWSVAWVLAIVPTLATLEFSGHYDDEDAAHTETVRQQEVQP
jgi:predicted MFS family arabinose efflux permease